MIVCVFSISSVASADERRLTEEAAVAAAHLYSPDVAVSRSRERIAAAEIDVAGTYPNPTVYGASSTQAARLSAGAMLPLLIFGQRGLAMDAARADADTTRTETLMAWVDARWATERAFVELWRSERALAARKDASALVVKLDAAVTGRAEVGSGPQIDALRAHAERLSVEADAMAASAQVRVAAAALARWTGDPPDVDLHVDGNPSTPDAPPPLATLLTQLSASVHVKREFDDARASRMRASRERGLNRPLMLLDLGADAFDSSLPATNLRAQLAIEVPLFNQRGGFIDRERANEDVAMSRQRAVLARVSSELVGAYRSYEAATDREKVLTEAVLPASEASVHAMQDAYDLGRSALLALLDAQRALLITRVDAIEATATRAAAWADVQHALGSP